MDATDGDRTVTGVLTTVLGVRNSEDMGITMMHEHVFIDLSVWFEKPETPTQAALAERPVEMSQLGRLRRQPFSTTLDNLRLDSYALAVEEVLEFKRAGGRAIVDVTSKDLGRDPEALSQVARETGIDVVMGCGYYVEPAHPPALASKEADEIAEELVAELTKGVADSQIRAGIIGEIGTSGISRETGEKHGNITLEETKVLRAAARASLATGAAVSVHLDPRGEGAFDVIRICAEEGLPPDRLILGHMDHVPSEEYHKNVADSGVYVQYDNFGREYYWDSAGVYWNNDHWRVKMLTELVRSGYMRQLLVSQDVALKMDLKSYGGYGYGHILVDIVPALLREGLSPADIETILIHNPRQALALRRTTQGDSGGARC